MRRRRRSIDIALASLSSADPTIRSSAIVSLGFHPFDHARSRPAQRQIDQVFAQLVRLARHDTDTTVRLGAVYVLAHWDELRSARVLLTLLARGEELPTLRGQAAEGLASILCGHRSRRSARLVEAATVALRAGLHDAAPDVRFWCIYALATLKITTARADIEALTIDDALCPGMWRVADEARDALLVLDGHAWPERAPGL